MDNARLAATRTECKALAASIFSVGWKLIAYALYQSRAPIEDSKELEQILNEFFTDPDTESEPGKPAVKYGEIALNVILDDQPSLESFRRQKHYLETSENLAECQFCPDMPAEDLAKIEREDLLRSMIKLALLPSRRFPESNALRDRQRWVFSEDMFRLVKKYLPESGLEVSFEDLKDLILSVMPRLKTKPALIAIIDDYREDIEGDVLDLLEAVDEFETITEVPLSMVIIDGKTHISGIGTQNIEFSALGILKHLASLNFDVEHSKDFEEEVKSQLFKITDFLRGSEDKKFSVVFGLLGKFRDILYEIEDKLKKLRGIDKAALNSKQRKQKSILDSIGVVLSDIAEIMPISFNLLKKHSGVTFRDPNFTG